MITPPTDCFYVIRAEGEAAEHITSTLSLAAMADIEEAVLISKDYHDDIEATNDMDEAVRVMRTRLLSETLIEQSTMNPLYTTASVKEIEKVMDGETDAEHFKFNGMDGSPFIIKIIDVRENDKPVIQGKLACRPFELPTYSEIIKAHTDVRLN